MIGVRTQVGALLSADPTTLAPAASANKMFLYTNNLPITENNVIADLNLATFTGATPIAGETGTQGVGTDPSTGQQIITILDPVGGYRWTTADTVNLPQTIYGYGLMNNAGTVLVAAENLPAPITLTAAGQQIDLGSVTMRVVQQPIS